MQDFQNPRADRALGRLARNYALNGSWISLRRNCDLARYVCGKMPGSCLRFHNESILATPPDLDTGIQSPRRLMLLRICARAFESIADSSSDVLGGVWIRVKAQVFAVEDRSDLPWI